MNDNPLRDDDAGPHTCVHCRFTTSHPGYFQNWHYADCATFTSASRSAVPVPTATEEPKQP